MTSQSSCERPSDSETDAVRKNAKPTTARNSVGRK
jgi:hypothetical protein